MSYLNIILIVGFIKYIHQVLYAVYILQLKEYRHDRLKEHLTRKHKYWHRAWFHMTIGAPFSLQMLPKPTGKAMLLVGLSLIVGFVLVWLLALTGLLTSLIFSLALVVASLALLAPIEYAIRQYMYKKARAKIDALKSRGLVVVGITGSYGKTSTKNFLKTILSIGHSVLTTESSVNTPLGISKAVLKQLDASHRFFIVEMGAYKIGEIKEICDIVQPDTAIITGISNQHLALFGSQKNIIKTKSELLESLKPNSNAYVNKNSPYKPIINNPNINVYFYSQKSIPSALLQKLEQLDLPKFLKENVTPCILIARDYGISIAAIKKSLEHLVAEEQTMLVKKGRRGAVIINDTRNASEFGLATALSFLSTIDTSRTLVIMPCIIELGQEAEKTHRHIGSLFTKHHIEAIITTDDYYDSLIKGAGPTGKNRIFLMPDAQRVCAYIKEHVNDNWAVLLEGKVNPVIVNFLYKH